MLIRIRRVVAGERGSATLWFAIIAAALFMLVGLVADGAGKANAARVAQMSADEAARAAGQQLTSAAIEGHLANVDPSSAATAAEDYLAAVGVSGSVSVQGRVVVVTTRVPWAPRFLPFGAKTLTGTATAETIRT